MSDDLPLTAPEIGDQPAANGNGGGEPTIEQLEAMLAARKAQADPNAARRDMLNLFATRFKLPNLEALEQHGEGALAHYTLRFIDGRTVRVPSVQALCSRATMHRLLLAELRRPIDLTGKATDWTEAIGVLIEHASELTEDDDAIARVEEWITQLGVLARTGPKLIDDPNVEHLLYALRNEGALRDRDGHLYLYGPKLLQRVNREATDSVNREQAGAVLRAAGFELHRLSVRTDNKRHQPWTWRSTEPWITG